jgi:thiol-disulfide isomerase/thioredoxin
MKPHLFVFPLLALLPLQVLAQAPAAPLAPQPVGGVTIDPAARAVLDRAIKNYKGASGIRFSSGSSDGVASNTALVRYSSPSLLRVDTRREQKPTTLLLDGSYAYRIWGDEYRKMPADYGQVSPLAVGMVGNLGLMMAGMMAGRNPIEAKVEIYSQLPFEGLKSRTVALGARVVDGDVLQGIQSTMTYAIEGQAGTAMREQTTAWFGGSPFLLRRLQTITSGGLAHIKSTLSEKIVDQELSPSFAPDTFVFKAAGLKRVRDDDEEEEEEPKPADLNTDPRLKVGAVPLPLVASDLQGQPVSLENYKGKVVLLDFWATWCGPYVSALPELKRAYDKYHAQGLEVVGISLDEDRKALTSFIERRQMPWLQVFDGKGWKSKIPTDYGVRSVPFMLLIGKDGNIAAINPGDDVDDGLDKAVKAALAAH